MEAVERYDDLEEDSSESEDVEEKPQRMASDIPSFGNCVIKEITNS